MPYTHKKEKQKRQQQEQPQKLRQIVSCQLPLESIEVIYYKLFTFSIRFPFPFSRRSSSLRWHLMFQNTLHKCTFIDIFTTAIATVANATFLPQKKNT